MIALQDAGQTVATYTGLRVTDAKGRLVPATMAAASDGSAIEISVRDERAAYPIFIDPVWSDIPYDMYEISGAGVAPINPSTQTVGTLAAYNCVDCSQMAITPNGQTGYLLVLNDRGGFGPSVVVPINLSTGTEGTPITLPPESDSIVMAPNGQTAYVTSFNFGSNSVTPINVATNTAQASIPVSYLVGLSAISLDGKTLYMGGVGAGNYVVPMNLATHAVGSPIPLPTSSNELVLSPDGQTLYSVNQNGVVPVHLANDSVGTMISISGSGDAMSLAITPDSQTGFLSTYYNNEITPINLVSDTLGTPISTGSLPNDEGIGPTSVVIDPTGQTIYALSLDGYVIPIAVANGSLGTPFLTPSSGTLVIDPQLNVYPRGAALAADTYGGGSKSEPCQCTGVPATHSVGDPIDTATGDLYQTSTDLTLPGAGLPLAFARTYDAQAAQTQAAAGTAVPALGYGWSDNLGVSVSYNSSTQTATVTEENGAQTSFTAYVSGTSPSWCTAATNFCASAPRIAATLNQNTNGTWTYVRTSGALDTFTFSAAGALTKIADAAGDTVSSSTYAPGSGQTACPTSDTCAGWTSSASGRELVLATNSVGRLVEVFDANSSLEGTFAYSGTGCTTWSGSQTPDLCSVVDPGGITSNYTYDSGNATASFGYDMLSGTAPGASSQTINVYNSSGQVTQQTDAAGAVTTLAYAGTNSSALGGTTTVTNYPDGTGAGEPQNVTVDDYSSSVLVQETTGDGTSAASTVTIQRDPTSLLPVSVLDGDGNSTTSTYQTFSGPGGTPISSGNVLTSTDGIGNTTSNAYNAFNQAWCTVDPADYANGSRCPASAPVSPPTPGSGDPNLGMTINYYNAADQLSASTDALGNTTTYNFTSGVSGVPNGLVYCSLDPVSYQKGASCPAYGAAHVSGTTTSTFDAAGDKTSSTNADDGTTTYAYALGSTHPGLTSSKVDPDGTTTTFTYNGAGQVTNQSATFGSYVATTLSAYDTHGRLYCTVGPFEAAKGVTCPASPPSPSSAPANLTSTFYDADGRVIQTTNPIGGTTVEAYDSAGNTYCSVTPVDYASGTRCPSTEPTSAPTIGSDPYLGATIDTFNALNQVIQVTNPLGGITLNTYNGDGLVTQAVAESNDATNDPTVTTTTTYDADNNVVSTTVDSGSSLAQTTRYFYDPNGKPYCLASAKAVGEDSTYQCPTWQPSWITSRPSPSALYATSPSPTQANGVTMSFYDSGGNLLQQTNADVSTTVNAVDPDGHPYCIASGLNVSAWLSAHGGSTYPYLCPASAPTSAPAPGSNPGYETKIYDAAGNMLSDTDGNGDTTSNTYDTAGDVTTTTSGTGGVTTNCYYVASCASGAPSGGGAGSSLYATTSQRTQADSSGIVTTYSYYSGGLADVTTTPAGKTTANYDANGDQISSTYSATASGYSAPANVTHTYFPDGSQQTMTDGTGTTTTTENAMGQTLTSAFSATGTGLTSSTTTYTYFSTGARHSLTYPPLGSVTSPQVTYTYDATGAEATMTDWQGHTTTFSHDADGNTTSTADPNSTTVADTYNLGDATTNVAAAPTSSPSSTFATFSTPRESSEQMSSETDTGTGTGTTTYNYTAAQQLSGVNSTTAAYDAAGNSTTLASGATQNYDAADELCWSTPTTPSPLPANPNAGCATAAPPGATTFAYNSQGDRTTATGPTGAATASYSYNQTGQLTGDTPGVNASSYTPLTPTRVCDTRSGNQSSLSGIALSNCNAKTLGAASSVQVQLSGTGMPVPVGASAVVANITAINQSGSGGSYVTVYPTGQSLPNTSNVDMAAGAVINNQATVGVGTNSSGAASITVYNAADTVDVLVDVVGYYTTGTGGSSYIPVTPTRICDSRSGNPSGLSGADAQCNGSGNSGSPIGNSSTLNVTATGSGYPEPAGATAVVADVTAIFPTAATTFLTAYQQGSTRPSTSSLNATSGTVVNKEVTIPLNTSNGQLTLYNAAGTTNVTVDVEGYFTGGSNSLFDTATPPQRICDSRSGNPSLLSGAEAQCNGTSNSGSTLAAGATKTIAAAGLAGVPASATAVVVNLTAVNETGAGYLAVYPAGATRPFAAQLDFVANTALSNEVTVGIGSNRAIDIYSSAATSDVVVDILGYYVAQSAVPASTYTYNGAGLRMSSTIGGVTSKFSYDTTAAVPSILEDGTNAYVYGPGGAPVEQISTAGVASYFVSDQLGSTRALTNGSGTVVATYNYGVLGNITGETGTVTTPIGFAGAYTDANSGLLYLINRYYDPTTGQFMSVDPDVAITSDPYGYAGDNPVNGSDPIGLCNEPGTNHFLVPGPCNFSNSSWARQAETYLSAEKALNSGQFSFGNFLKSQADFWVGAANTVVSAVTLGQVQVSAPFCSFSDEYLAGGIYANVVSVAVIGSEAYAARAAAAAAEAGATTLEAGDLSGDVLSNYNRFLKSLPSGAGDSTITHLSDGSYQFSADVPATNIPGSYATYTKVVGPNGVTTTFYKTTVASDGSIVSVKVKYP